MGSSCDPIAECRDIPFHGVVANRRPARADRIARPPWTPGPLTAPAVHLRRARWRAGRLRCWAAGDPRPRPDSGEKRLTPSVRSQRVNGPARMSIVERHSPRPGEQPCPESPRNPWPRAAPDRRGVARRLRPGSRPRARGGRRGAAPPGRRRAAARGHRACYAVGRGRSLSRQARGGRPGSCRGRRLRRRPRRRHGGAPAPAARRRVVGRGPDARARQRPLVGRVHRRAPGATDLRSRRGSIASRHGGGTSCAAWR